MKPSKSQFIELESIPMKDLFKSQVGATGLYVPTPDAEGSLKQSIARISSAAKRWGTVENKRSVVHSVVLLTTHQGDELPTPQKLVQITLVDIDDLSPRARIFREAKAAKRKEQS